MNTPLKKPAGKVMVFHEEDWWDFCAIMRSLTWGQSSMDDWSRLRKRVNDRNTDPDEARANTEG